MTRPAACSVASHFFRGNWVIRIRPEATASPSTLFAETMQDYTRREKAKITAGAFTALVIVAWLAVIALALLWA
jgi:hypothetical protein